MTAKDALNIMTPEIPSGGELRPAEPAAPPPEAGAYEARRAGMVAKIPAFYRPSVHLAIPTILGLAAMIGAFVMIHDLRLVELVTVPITLFAAFGFEWRAHKFILHKRRPLLGTLYVRHELIHHVVFTYESMAMKAPRELWFILMPAYAIVLVFVMMAPIVLGIAWLFGLNIALLMLATSMFFFLSYEWLHMAYHLPETTWLGGRKTIARLRELHRRHHDPRLMKRWNFNVTVPVFDLILGTLWSPEREAARQGARGDKANGASAASS